jgi:nucleotide-binding universal stress UspA family protein
MNIGIHSPLNILLAVDGSKNSVSAINLINDLPLREGSTITIISVLIPREAGLKTYALRDFLARTEERFNKNRIETKTELLTGNPAEELIDFAGNNKSDLIVLGAKGLRSTLGFLLGGVAQQVVEYAPCPVLIVRAPYNGLHHALIVTDGSDHSNQALRYLGNFPLPERTKIHVAHVLPPILTPEFYSRSWPDVSEAFPKPIFPETEEAILKQYKEEEHHGKVLLEKACTCLEETGVSADCVLLRGDAATEIINYVKDQNIDLLLAGSRGLSRFKSWVLGSVSRKLVHYANCSTMIVK